MTLEIGTVVKVTEQAQTQTYPEQDWKDKELIITVSLNYKEFLNP